jgi:hypothetical protein
VGGWRYDAYQNVLKSYNVKTTGAWPFEQLETGLVIDCQYDWNGSELTAIDGSGSRGDFDGKRFKMYCCPKGQSRLVFEYEYKELGKRFEPVGAPHLPVWVMNESSFKNVNGVSQEEFPDLLIEGSIPAAMGLVAAMHNYQWKQEGTWQKS